VSLGGACLTHGGPSYRTRPLGRAAIEQRRPERLDTSRMTVLKTDLATGRLLCVEHLRCTPAGKAISEGWGRATS